MAYYPLSAINVVVPFSLPNSSVYAACSKCHPRMTTFHGSRNTASNPVKTIQAVGQPACAAAAARVVDCVDVGAAVMLDVLCALPDAPEDMIPWTMTVLVAAAGRLATAVDMTMAVVRAGEAEVSTSRVSDAVTRFATGIEKLA